MSLINEALRRTEEDKRANSPVATDATIAAVPETSAQARKRRVNPALLVGMLAVAAAAGGWVLLHKSGPKAASARSSLLPPGQKAVVAAKPAPKADPQQVRQAQETVAKTVKALTYYNPPPPRIVVREPRPEELLPTRPTFDDQTVARYAAEEGRKPKKKTVISVSGFSVSGIMYSDLGATAIINGRLVQAGDSVSGARVVKIAPSEIQLENNDGIFYLRM